MEDQLVFVEIYKTKNAPGPPVTVLSSLQPPLQRDDDIMILLYCYHRHSAVIPSSVNRRKFCILECTGLPQYHSITLCV